MKGWRRKWIIAMLCVMPVMAGCRVIVVDESKEKSEVKQVVHKSSEALKLDAKVQVFKKSLLIRSETTLPKGAIVDVQLKPYPDDATSLQIIRTAVEPLDTVASSGTVKVKKDGIIESITIPRPDENKRYRLEILVDPRKQNEDVQEALGPLGENLSNSEGNVSITEKSQDITFLKKYANIMKREEPDGFMAKLDLVALDEQ
ncbi:hypothetical protein LCD52_00560 [Rossellomorea vietnamensis]|uniref:hypothetical protein n=1 Tax=Rossellomorea vietnamensis TaxID=218284 RepID=UPI001CCAE77B|nr:hypothetical protein [Rossellomorea vietnamensis]MCA0147271.1 hypothetical protein [Rossellomorea vietnamensis]